MFEFGVKKANLATMLSGAAVLTPASLTLSTTTLCELWLDACVLQQRTIFLFSPVSNLLSFVAKELRFL